MSIYELKLSEGEYTIKARYKYPNLNAEKETAIEEFQTTIRIISHSSK